MNLYDFFAEDVGNDFILYFNGKPVASYSNINDAEYQARQVKAKHPDLQYEIKKEVCTLTPVELKENLRKWFKEKWVRFGPDGKIRGACARGDDSEGKPKCLPQAKAHALGKKGRKYAASKKRREDPNPERRGPAKNVATKKKSNEDMMEVSDELRNRYVARASDDYGSANFAARASKSHPGLEKYSRDQEARAKKRAAGLNRALSDKRRGMDEGHNDGASNIGAQIRAAYKKIYDAGDDAVEFAYYDSPIFAQYWDEYEGDLDSIIAEVDPSELQIILDELTAAAEDQEDDYYSLPMPNGDRDELDEGGENWIKLPNGNYRNTHTGVVASKPPTKKKRGEKTGAEWDAIKAKKQQGVAEDAEPQDREFALVKKLGRLGQRIVQNPRLWEKYTEAVDSNNLDWIISLIQEGTGADKTEVRNLDQIFGEIGGGLGRLVDFAWAVKEGTWEQDFMNPYRQHRSQGVAEGLNEFAPAGGGGNIPRGPKTPNRGPWGDNGEDPYQLRRYNRSIDFFDQFDSEGVDKQKFDKASGEYEGYYFDRDAASGITQIAYFKFDDPTKIGDNDPGVGWYYEPIDESLSEQELDEACWKGYHKEGNKKMFGKTYPNCVKNTNEEQELEEKWSQKYKDSINCSNPKGFSQKAHCAGKKKNEDVNESAEVKRIQNYLNKKYQANLDVDGEMGPLTKKTINKFMPKTDKQLAPEPDKTTRVQGKQIKNEQRMQCPECGGPMFSDLVLAEKQDACYNKVKSRYKVWPSAYASGALVQCRKKGAANWGNKSKNESVEEARAATAAFRAGNKKRAELNAMSDEELRAYDREQQEKQRKRDDARLERERQKLAAKKGVTEMDSQKPQGRYKADGTRSHSTYGSRDHYNLGDPETTLGPGSVIPAKDVAKKASRALDKAFSKSHKKGMAEGANCAMTEEGAMCPVHGLHECPTGIMQEAVSGLELAEVLLNGFEQKYPDLFKTLDRKDVENTIMDAVEMAGDVDSMSDVDMMIDDLAMEFNEPAEPEQPIDAIKETKLYYNVVGTPDQQLLREFRMRKDSRGWYLNEDVEIKHLMTAFRAFGEPTRL